MDKEEFHDINDIKRIRKFRILQLIGTTILGVLLSIQAIYYSNMFWLIVTIICVTCFDYIYLKEILSLNMGLIVASKATILMSKEADNNSLVDVINSILEVELNNLFKVISMLLFENIVKHEQINICKDYGIKDYRIRFAPNDEPILECLLDEYNLRISYTVDAKTLKPFKRSQNLSVGIAKSDTWTEDVEYAEDYVNKLILQYTRDYTPEAHREIEKIINLGKNIIGE